MIATYNDLETTCNVILRQYDIYTNVGATLQLLYDTGLRAEEAVQLERFTLTSSTFIVNTEKNSSNREFPLSILPAAYIQALSAPPISGYPYTIGSYTSLVRAVKMHSDKQYYKDKKFLVANVFRYRYVRYLQSIGYTIEQIANDLGHLSLTSTASYLQTVHY